MASLKLKKKQTNNWETNPSLSQKGNRCHDCWIIIFCGRCFVRWAMGQEVTVLRHSQVFVLCFWARHFNLLVSLSTQEYFVLNCKREGC